MNRELFAGFGSTAAGIIVLVLRSIAVRPDKLGPERGLSWAGLVIGILLAVLGFALAKRHENKTVGYLVTGAGVLTVLASLRFFPIFGQTAGFMLLIAGIAFLLGGAISFYRYFRMRR